MLLRRVFPMSASGGAEGNYPRLRGIGERQLPICTPRSECNPPAWKRVALAAALGEAVIGAATRDCRMRGNNRAQPRPPALRADNRDAHELPSSPEAPTTDVADWHQARVDKSVLTVSAPRRYRNKASVRFVTQQPCLLCGRKPSDAHHLSFVQPRALGRKASDEFAVPLCRIHHRAVHRSREERGWWEANGIDPIKVARKLWKDTRTNKPPDPIGMAPHQPHETLKPHEVDGKAS
jgi:hypothetical protein